MSDTVRRSPRPNKDTQNSPSAKQQSERAAKYHKQMEEIRKRREITGIILIAMGILLAVFLYFKPDGILSELIPGFIFGLLGFFGYGAPIVLLICGILVITFAAKRGELSRSLLVVGVTLCILSFAHIIVRDEFNASSYINFVVDSFKKGESIGIGGGLFGALFSYPTVLLLGDVGGCIVFAFAIIIQIILITNISIKAASEKVGTTIKNNVAILSERREVRREEKRTREEDRKLFFEQVSLDDNSSTSPDSRRKPVVVVQEDTNDLTILPPNGPLLKGESPAQNTRPDGSIRIIHPTDQTIEPTEKPLFDVTPIASPLLQQSAIEKQHNPFAEPQRNDHDEVFNYDFGDYERFLPKRPGDRREKLIDVDELDQEINFEQVDDDQLIQQELPLNKVLPMQSVQQSSRAKKQLPYMPPPISLLNLPSKFAGVREDPAIKAKILEETLASFGISAKVTNVSQGPSITRFELQPAPGVRVNRITNLSDDIALNLAAPRVRIEAPIPGKAVVGVEVPNQNTSMVTLREMLTSPEFTNAKSKVCVALGRDIAGKIVLADIAKMPHLLIAGSTGSGKSVCINCIICSLIYHASPEDVKLILVDPKVVELASFSNLPHLLVPVVTDPKKAASALKWAVSEMTQRYQNFAKRGARDLARYNELAMADGQIKLPQIIIIVDELADLMMVAPDDVEDSICRIAQMGRAAGLHLTVATQRPSADVITGIIKANIPSRIAFAVASATDSRIILDSGGAEKLLGKGDMLFSPTGASQVTRVQGALVTDVEVEKIAAFFENRSMGGGIDHEVVKEIESVGSHETEQNAKRDGDDELLPDAVEVIMTTGQASISMLQRRMRLGYARAARLIDLMEQMGIVSGYDGSKARKLLIDRADFERIFGTKPNIPDLGS